MAYKDRDLFSCSSGGWKSDGRCRQRGSFWRLRGTLLHPPLLASFCWWLAILGIRWLVEASLQSLSPSLLACLLSLKVTLPLIKTSVVSDPNDLISIGSPAKILFPNNLTFGTSLVVQWLRLCTPKAGVQSLVMELDPTWYN